MNLAAHEIDENVLQLADQLLNREQRGELKWYFSDWSDGVLTDVSQGSL